MKGVILAGGTGSRLRPLTAVTNKHLLPVYDRPMVHFPLRSLLEAGIDEILVVTGGPHAGELLRVLGDGDDLGIRRLAYAHQPAAGGIADALARAEAFAGGEPVCAILGDNVVEASLAPIAQAFRARPEGALAMLKAVEDPRPYGVPRFEGDWITAIEEKPADPPSRYAVTGAYFLDAGVFDHCAAVAPSRRGEREITDVLNAYAARGALRHRELPGFWCDAGTFDDLLAASRFAAGETG